MVFKKEYLLLLAVIGICGMLYGCNEPDLIAEWSSNEKQFNKEKIEAELNKAIAGLPVKRLSVSGLSKETHHDGKSTVTRYKLGINIKSSQLNDSLIKEVHNRVVQHTKTFVTPLTQSFKPHEIALTQYSVAMVMQFEAEHLKDKTKTNFTTAINWATAEIEVHGPRSYSRYNFSSPECKVVVKLAEPLKSAKQIYQFREVKLSDLDRPEFNQYTIEQKEKFIAGVNKKYKSWFGEYSSHHLNYDFNYDLSNIPEYQYLMKKFDGLTIGDDKLVINIGSLSSSDGNSAATTGIDFGGAAHRQCEEMVEDDMPDFYEFLQHAKLVGNIKNIEVNKSK